MPANTVPGSYIRRDLTNALKGIAIVFMLIHHFFTFPDWYQEGIAYPSLIELAGIFRQPFKICVPIFAFLTGYFYAFTPPTLQYSLKKSTDLWLNYLVALLVLMIPAIALGCFTPTAENILLEVLGLRRKIVTFCWYVNFYIFTMLLLPLYARLAKRHILLGALAGILAPVFIIDRVNALGLIQDPRLLEQFNYLSWFPAVASGFLFAQYGLFSRVFDPVFKRSIPGKALRVCVYGALMAIGFMGRRELPAVTYHLKFSLDILWAPLFIYGAVNLLECIRFRAVHKGLCVLGKYSLGMWFVHSVFFNCCAAYTQKILYFPGNAVLVLLWGMVVSLTAAKLICIPANALVRTKNKLLFSRGK